MTIKDAKIAYHIKSEKSIRDWIKQYKSEKVEICIENILPMAKVKPSVQDLEKGALHKALQEQNLESKL
ncbi:MAG: hypothetical protein LC127_01135 [Chitinophagales bacterium]|nr:hypothetical protein [Chitinophagales bacterium]